MIIARLISLLDSAVMARAYALAALGIAVFQVTIENVSDTVTLTTMVVLLAVLGLAILVVRRRELSILRLAPTTLVLFVLWLGVTVVWAKDSWLSLLGWLALVGWTIIAVVVAHIRDTLQTVRALGDVMRVALAVSLILEIMSGILLDMPFPFLGIQGNIAEGGPLQGVFGTRNLLGLMAVIALLTFIIEHRTQSVSRALGVGSMVLAALFAVLSASPTVAVIAVAAAATTAILAIVRHTPPKHRGRVQWTIGGGVVVAGLVAYVMRHQIIAFLGAGSDFSTRADLWNVLLDYSEYSPLGGYGWYGPWARSEFPFFAINLATRDTHASALNAFFDVLLQAGWIGLILFSTLCAVALVRAWLVASERRSVLYAWTPLILVTIIVDSVFESFALEGMVWMLLVLCAMRAGQSRSWRERVETGVIPTITPPHAQG